MTLGTATQLDLFLDSRAVVLANEIAGALLAGDARRAHAGLAQAKSERLEHPSLSALESLAWTLAQWQVPQRDAAQIQAATTTLDRVVMPLAATALGPAAGQFLARFFADLAQAACGLRYEPAFPRAHRAYQCLRAGDFDAAEQAVLTIADWHAIGPALHWLAVARYRKGGLDAARVAAFMLAWRQPSGFCELLSELGDELMLRHWEVFEAACEWPAVPEGELAAWFPAWYLLEHPASAGELEHIDLPATPAATAVRLLLRLLHLERRGDQRALVAARRQLRDLNAELFGLYMARRTVWHR